MLIIAAIGIYFGVKGYEMYRDAVSQVSVEEKVEEIRREEHFVSYSDLPEFYINAVISVEDHRFLRHPGIDLISICRAAWTDLKAGYFKEGGSTITQQLAKNMFFTQDKIMVRKVAEIFAAFEIEAKYSKEEIFELYVNTASFGNGYEGVYAASKGYFGKEPSKLKDYEAVMLAGVPNAPSLYDLDENMELTSGRVGEVLYTMVRNKLLTQKEADHIQDRFDQFLSTLYSSLFQKGGKPEVYLHGIQSGPSAFLV